MSDDYCFYEESLPEWGIERITLAHDDAGAVFYPVGTICTALALDQATYAAYLRADSRLFRGVREIRAPTAGGRQRTLYVRRRECAIWLAVIDPARVGKRAKAYGRLSEFQAALWHLAERTAFHRRRSVDAGAEDTGTVVQLQGAQRGEILCECGRLHVIEIANGEMRVWHK